MDDRQLVVTRWLTKAGHDLDTARTMLRRKDPPTDIVCFHCQQCAEKCLKAFLTSADVEFPKTHDLGRLLSLCVAPDSGFRLIDEYANALTDYAVETRYPDDWREIPVEEAKQALQCATSIITFVRRRLASELRHEAREP